MARAIEIPIKIDTEDGELRKLEKGFKDVDKSLEKVEDGAKDASKKIDRDLTEALKDAARQGEKTGRSIGEDVKSGAHRAEQAVDDFKDEARQNFAETASSFDGSMDSIADMAQSTLGGLATAIPGAGAALAGLGAIAGTFYAQWRENAEKTEARIQGMYADMLESGENYLSESYIQEEMGKIVSGADDAVISWEMVEKAARISGMSQAEVLRAFAGDAELAAKLLAALNAEQESLGEGANSANADLNTMIGTLEEGQDSAKEFGERLEVFNEAQKATPEATRELNIALAETPEIMQSATDAINANNEALGGTAAAAAANKGELSELAGSLLDVQEAQEAVTGEGEELVALQKEQAEGFIKTAEAAGYSRDAAIDLAVELGLIPEEVATQIRTEGAPQAQTAARNTTSEYKKIPTEVKTNIKFVPPSIAEAQSQVNAIARGLIPPKITINVTGRQMPV